MTTRLISGTTTSGCLLLSPKPRSTARSATRTPSPSLWKRLWVWRTTPRFAPAWSARPETRTEPWTAAAAAGRPRAPRRSPSTTWRSASLSSDRTSSWGATSPPHTVGASPPSTCSPPSDGASRLRGGSRSRRCASSAGITAPRRRSTAPTSWRRRTGGSCARYSGRTPALSAAPTATTRTPSSTARFPRTRLARGSPRGPGRSAKDWRYFKQEQETNKKLKKKKKRRRSWSCTGVNRERLEENIFSMFALKCFGLYIVTVWAHSLHPDALCVLVTPLPSTLKIRTKVLSSPTCEWPLPCCHAKWKLTALCVQLTRKWICSSLCCRWTSVAHRSVDAGSLMQTRPYIQHIFSWDKLTFFSTKGIHFYIETYTAKWFFFWTVYIVGCLIFYVGCSDYKFKLIVQ